MAENVKDVKFSELPEDFRNRLLDVSKIVRSGVQDEFDNSDLHDTKWGTEKLRQFNIWFQDGVGDCRIYQNGNSYACMVQLTGHVHHDDEDPDCEKFCSVIHKAFRKLKPKCKKLGFTLVSEGKSGENFEGFDVWPDEKTSKELWDHFPDKKERRVEKFHEDGNETEEEITKKVIPTSALPRHLQELIEHTNGVLQALFMKSVGTFNEKYDFSHVEETANVIGGFTEDGSCIGNTLLLKRGDLYEGYIELTPPILIPDRNTERLLEFVYQSLKESFDSSNPCKELLLTGDENIVQFEMGLTSEYTQRLWRRSAMSPRVEYTKFPRDEGIVYNYSEKGSNIADVFKRNVREIPHNVKDSLGSVVSTIMLVSHPILLFLPRKKVQRFLNAASDCIDPKEFGAKGFTEVKFNVIEDDKNGNTQVPKLVIVLPDSIKKKEFLKQFVYGETDFRSSIQTSKVICISYNNAAIGTIRDKDDMYYTMRDMTKYYGVQLVRIADQMQNAIKSLPARSKEYLVSELSSILRIAFDALTTFTHIDMNDQRGRHSLIEEKKKIGNIVTEFLKTIPEDPKSEDPESIIATFKSKLPTGSFSESTEMMFIPYLEKEDGKAGINSIVQPLVGMKDLTNPKQSPTDKIKTILSAASKAISDGPLKTWGTGWNELKIELMKNSPHKDGVQIPCIRFHMPSEARSKPFAQRFINGHESFQGFHHRDPRIRIEINASALATMKKADDFYDTIHALAQYYEKPMVDLVDKVQSEFVKFPVEFKKILCETSLYHLVELSLEQFYLIAKVDMSNPKAMVEIPKKTADASTAMIKGLPTKPVQSKEEQKRVLDDYKRLVNSYYECGGVVFGYVEFLEGVTDLMNGKFQPSLERYRQDFLETSIDNEWTRNPPSYEIKYLQEKLFVKKLKKIPTDLVAYISIETDAIRDANDKMMIASYCLSKLEIVEWYIELLEVGSKKYIVPHTLPQLNSIRTQLLACYDRIMKVKIKPLADRPILGEIRYPAGYEG